VEEFDAQLGFQRLDLACERRLRDAQPFGRAADMAGLCDRDEIAELAVCEVLHTEKVSYPANLILEGMILDLQCPRDR
jgi:hypothetical protein